MDFKEYQLKKRQVFDLKVAKSRCWSSWWWCLGAGFVGSLVRSAQTSNWRPTFIATGVAAVCIPISTVDMGVTLAVAPPVTAAALFTSDAMTARKKLRIITPLEAEAKLYEFGEF